ncbi:hypothetical protein [Mameliella alba]|uniref:Uncharacterized protein n=1 Tax=Mameliella alba TaxID=561184 RepID=A0A0B3SIG2_9RHOB|nr:hypothetical protein [Mameliella alba]KHQ50359.1 hypothetical protein OA50_05034 [Mameliella alba]
MTPTAFTAFLFLAALVGALAGFGAGCLASRLIRRQGPVPMITIGNGVHVQWMRAAEARRAERVNARGEL